MGRKPINTIRDLGFLIAKRARAPVVPQNPEDEMVRYWDEGFRRAEQEPGSFYDPNKLPQITQASHYRRMELLDALPIGDVSDQVCVDYGVGSWGFACIYPRLQHCRKAIGIDISQEAIRISEQISHTGDFPYGQNYQYLTSEGDDIGLDDASVDLFFAGEVIEHVEKVEAFLGEVHRILKPEGLFILTTPNADAYLYRLHGERYCFNAEHVSLMSFAELQSFLASCFEVLIAKGFNGSFYRLLDDKITDPQLIDVYVMVDGDDTYPPQDVHRLIAPILADEADMVVGSRLQAGNQRQFNILNRFGNWLFALILNLFFNAHLTDILSGYRAFNHRFVKDVPLFSGGFEIETELTIKALQRGHRIIEVPVDLKRRPEGSKSKINLVRDGVLILSTIMTLFRDYKPLTFFGISGLILLFAGVISIVITLPNDLAAGQSLLLPSTILSVVLLLASLLAIPIGIILHTIDRRFQELELNMKSMSQNIANWEKERTSREISGRVP